MHELDDNRSSGIYEAHRPSKDKRGQKDMRIRRNKGFIAWQIFFNGVPSHSNRNSRQLSAKHANITAVNVNQIPKNGPTSGNIFQCSSTVKVEGKQSRLPKDRASAGIWWRDKMITSTCQPLATMDDDGTRRKLDEFLKRYSSRDERLSKIANLFRYLDGDPENVKPLDIVPLDEYERHFLAVE
ncbi:hypothetical protein BKA56DRAFT_733646 [Ilyonectria sp. MPI-CAGE-AT-0026]|nr:hypothetical protein BKA56DRAFT_733646 [Ilyonectria sp. MPI-CAGE-AT-0026]